MSGKTYFGTAGWSYEDWRGRVYPPSAGSRFDPLAHICRYFDLVEVNATFYRLPPPQTAESWVKRADANAGFKFLLKAPQSWTHGPGPVSSPEIGRFRELAGILSEAGRLGAILIQFPWSFRHNEANLTRVSRIAEILSTFTIAVEVRHGSFAQPGWREHLARLDCIPVNVDQPVIGDSLELGDAASKCGAYFRLHGRNEVAWFDAEAGRDNRYDYLYPEAELAAVSDRIAAAVQALPHADLPVFVVTNNHYLGQAAVNALQLKAAAREDRVSVPTCLAVHYPELKKIALPTETGEQGQLF